MYASNSNEYKKFTTSPSLPSGPPPPVEIATGIPVSSNGQFYSDNNNNNNGPPVPVAPLQIIPKIRGPWSTGLCDCFSDVRNCCITLWCPCITFGQIADIVDKGSSSCGTSGALYALLACVTGCCCCLSCFYRTKLRQQLHLHEKPCADCLVHCCCESCALCQEYRQLKNHGFDMAIGWQGNAERQTREMEMEPVSPEGGMSR